MENLVAAEYLSAFYKNKKVFITGHTGFKGSWLMAWLHLLGAQIKGYALASSDAGNLYNLLEPENICEPVIADIRDKQRLQQEILAFQPDYVFHLAAQPLVRRSYQIPAETFEVNAVGTANLLEVITTLDHPCNVVVITTDKVYENKEDGKLYKEEDPLGGHDPYSASKACTELVVSSFRNSFFNNDKLSEHKKALGSARAGNVIGGGDWSTDRIIPDIIRSLKQEKVIEVRNPNAIRPWQHVLEPLGGYLLLAAHLQNLQTPPVFNFGPLPEDHLTVGQLVEQAISCWKSGKWQDCSSINQPHEAGILKLDISKAENELHWKPKLDASQAIESSIDWYKKPEAEKADFTYQQIKNYMAL